MKINYWVIIQSLAHAKNDISITAIKMEKCFLISLDSEWKKSIIMYSFSLNLGNNCGTQCWGDRMCAWTWRWGTWVWIFSQISPQVIVHIWKQNLEATWVNTELDHRRGEQKGQNIVSVQIVVAPSKYHSFWKSPYAIAWKWPLGGSSCPEHANVEVPFGCFYSKPTHLLSKTCKVE